MGTEVHAVLHTDARHVPANVAAAATAEALPDRAEIFALPRSNSVVSELNRVADQGGSVDVDDEQGATSSTTPLRVTQRAMDCSTSAAGSLRRVWDFSEAAAWLPSPGSIGGLLPQGGETDRGVVRERSHIFDFQRGWSLTWAELAKNTLWTVWLRSADPRGLSMASVIWEEICGSLGLTPAASPGGSTSDTRGRWRHPWPSLTLLQGSVAPSGDAKERFMEIDGRRYSHI